eukprot:TRINITY_DN13284_c0_g1_i3.p1 TRINITY_DN13284_c0_g1~~TRINITY_DN13284_c0_g1_i3.p1  ORF type:complete len:302 (+),score=83.25 TRINITY_DN13284_c0_g1_i3:157-1062(+)
MYSPALIFLLNGTTLLLAVISMMWSVRSLYRLGAPQNFNNAILLCYVALLLQPIPTFLLIVAFSLYPPWLSFYGINSCILLSTIAAAICSFLVCLQFHIGVIAAKKGSGKVSLKTKSIAGAIGFATIVCVLLVWENIEVDLQSKAGILRTLIGSAALGLFRLFLAIYCIWGTTRALKVLKHGSQEESHVKHISKRLILVSLFNLFVIGAAVFEAAPQTFLFNHGWVVITVIVLFNNVLTVVDLSAIPARKSREEVLESLSKKKNKPGFRQLEMPLFKSFKESVAALEQSQSNMKSFSGNCS